MTKQNFVDYQEAPFREGDEGQQSYDEQATVDGPDNSANCGESFFNEGVGQQHTYNKQHNNYNTEDNGGYYNTAVGWNGCDVHVHVEVKPHAANSDGNHQDDSEEQAWQEEPVEEEEKQDVEDGRDADDDYDEEEAEGEEGEAEEDTQEDDDLDDVWPNAY